MSGLAMIVGLFVGIAFCYILLSISHNNEKREEMRRQLDDVHGDVKVLKDRFSRLYKDNPDLKKS